MVMYNCNPSHREGIDRRITIQGWPWSKMSDPIWELIKNKNKKRLEV
jgi:hypothetical protein